MEEEQVYYIYIIVALLRVEFVLSSSPQQRIERHRQVVRQSENLFEYSPRAERAKVKVDKGRPELLGKGLFT